MDYQKGNSDKGRKKEAEEVDEVKPEKNVTKVIEGNARRVKKGGFQKAVDTFFPQEKMVETKNHIIFDVVVPTIQQLVFDTIESIIYPGGRPGKGIGEPRQPPKTNYNSIAYRKEDERRYAAQPVRSSVYALDDIILETRGEALGVLSGMQEIIDAYGCVCVADLLDMVGSNSVHTDNDYGWFDIRGAKVTQLRRGGYALDLPRPMVLPATVL